MGERGLGRLGGVSAKISWQSWTRTLQVHNNPRVECFTCTRPNKSEFVRHLENLDLLDLGNFSFLDGAHGNLEKSLDVESPVKLGRMKISTDWLGFLDIFFVLLQRDARYSCHRGEFRSLF